MLRLLTRRATAQFPLLAAIVAVVTIGATLLGVCALLLTVSQDRALAKGMAQATPAEVEVTAFVVGVKGEQSRSVAEDTGNLLTQSLAPFPAKSSLRASSIMRPLSRNGDGRRRLAYLSAVDDLADRARLTQGRWPKSSSVSTGPFETVLLKRTAQLLNLKLGSELRLGAEVSAPDTTAPVTVKVVGIFQPQPDSGWDRDPLAAAGDEPKFTDGRHPQAGHAFGPFMVDPADLFATGSELDRYQVTAVPDLSAPTTSGVNRAAVAMAGVDARLAKILGDRVNNERVASDLPATLWTANVQLAVTRSAVLVVVLLGTALTAAALGLAGRLVAALRTTETALFSALGASPGQLVAVAAVEAAALAVLAGVFAVPLSSVIHSLITHLLSDAGLATSPQVTFGQVLTVLGGALALTVALIVPALRPAQTAVVAGRGSLALLTRSGADLILLGLAITGWWQLRAQPATQTGTDAVRVLAPVLCLLAGAALAPRLVRLPLWAAERLARRSRGLVLPLAAFEAARRPRAVAAGLLLALAAATATFGVAFAATWDQSQHDQADAQVGTDLVLTPAAAQEAGQGSALAAATGGTVSPVTQRGVLIGRYTGDVGAEPRLLAVDSAHAGTLLRGQPPEGSSWARMGAALAARTPVTGIPLGSARSLTITATSQNGPLLQVTPTLVLQDRAGQRTPCDAQPVLMDGRAHQLPLCQEPVEGSQLVAVAVRVELDPSVPASSMLDGLSEISVAVSVPTTAGTTGATASTWAGQGLGSQSTLSGPVTTKVSTTAAATLVRMESEVKLRLLAYEPAEAVSAAFEAPDAVPAAVSNQLATTLGTSIGDELSIAVGGASVQIVVKSILAHVPSVPGQIAVLTDFDALSRALIFSGDLESKTDVWWVGRPTAADAGAAADALHLGKVVTRENVTDQLRRGPLRVGLPAALILLIPAAILLALAGTVMHVTSDIEARAVEMARLRGLGLSRRNILVGLLAQHGGVLTLLLAAGTVVGAVASSAIAPLLIRSDVGSTPIPQALALWPWTAEVGLLAVLLIGSIAAVALVITVQLRRADTAYLRAGA